MSQHFNKFKENFKEAFNSLDRKDFKHFFGLSTENNSIKSFENLIKKLNFSFTMSLPLYCDH
ncbi:CLUMA_CG002070, isoform A [Clunio marinus]|uniref:CLUMA_CG002070, isoform A n=1 Tax=Clunio marinus TaxID=568069 RepID=A0A1J1HK42_9DIPT|nr:CLUMA_CG002070, isoform A [Clunio marinus]